MTRSTRSSVSWMEENSEKKEEKKKTLRLSLPRMLATMLLFLLMELWLFLLLWFCGLCAVQHPFHFLLWQRKRGGGGRIQGVGWWHGIWLVWSNSCSLLIKSFYVKKFLVNKYFSYELNTKAILYTIMRHSSNIFLCKEFSFD